MPLFKCPFARDPVDEHPVDAEDLGEYEEDELCGRVFKAALWYLSADCRRADVGGEVVCPACCRWFRPERYPRSRMGPTEQLAAAFKEN